MSKHKHRNRATHFTVSSIAKAALAFEKIAQKYIDDERFAVSHPSVKNIDKPSLVKISSLNFVGGEIENLIAEDLAATGLKEFLADNKFNVELLSSLSERDGISFLNWHDFSEYLFSFPQKERVARFRRFSLSLAKYPSFVAALENGVSPVYPDDNSDGSSVVMEAARIVSTEKFVHRVGRIETAYAQLSEQGFRVFEQVVPEAKCTVCRKIKRWRGIAFLAKALRDGVLE